MRGIWWAWVGVWLLSGIARADVPPTLDDFWDGRAEWVIDIPDVGLPVGESDTVQIDARTFWSYGHASYQSAGVVDQCGEPVAFPGCLTRWESRDGGASFALSPPICLIPCQRCPCDDARDHITAQQYPRVARTAEGWYLAYEWHAQIMLRTSPDGLEWSPWQYLVVPGGTYPYAFAPCTPVEQIGPHPHIRGQADGCLIGAPPGLYVEGDTLYVFAAAGSAPGHMRCYKGSRFGDLSRLERCATDPLFAGAPTYGDIRLSGAAANPYFDFRYVSSAEVVRVGERYYMFYEGIRGPDVLERGMDTQFGLGLARSLTDQIDGPWEKYPHNPILFDMGFYVGVGHADFLQIDGVSYLYTQTSPTTRGRWRLVWKQP
jgi:hypothetical protein